MATIKLQPSGAVVIKDGKVSCGCCPQPSECCMYPAQALADEEYEASDLPDDVTINGTSFPRSGTTYGNTTNGVIFEENVWAKYTSGARSSRPCLIQGGVEDQFADTYTATDSTSTISVLVTRKSLCVWESEIIIGDEDDFIVTLKYLPSINKWGVDTEPSAVSSRKSPNQNTPVGNYLAGNLLAWTVS